MLLAAEARKHRALREVPVALVLALVYFILNAEPQNPVQDQRTLWFLTQQDIRAGVGTGVAFLTAVGLARLMTCERELGTGELIRSSRRGAAYTFGAKLGYAAIYCLLSVLLGMVFGLGVSGSGFGFEGAFEPVEEALYYDVSLTPGLTNIGYCLLQYLFLYIGTLYYAALVLLIAALCRRAVPAVILSGGLHVFSMLCSTDTIGRFLGYDIGNAAFRLHLLLPGGFVLHDSFNTRYWSSLPQCAASLGCVWKPLAFALAMTAALVLALWLIYKRRDKR